MKKWISSGYALTFFAALASASEALAEHYTIPLLVPATTSDAPQGVLRILNGTQESGTVELYSIDDAGTRFGPATFTLNASAAVEFAAQDLQSGNASMGLTGGIGADVGDARLVIETDLHIVPLAYVRAADGTLSAMHDTVHAATTDGSGPHIYNVPVFNPSSDAAQVSRLRLINPGDASASVTISGRDDSGGAATGGDVTLTLAAGGARTLTAQQLEAGDGTLTGQLGAGVGKWRLTVSSDQPLQVVNLIAATAGYLNNLSTTAGRGEAPTDQAALNERFVGVNVIYETGNGRFALSAIAGDRFTETGESDGVSTTFMGSYSYVGIGPDAGRLTLMYDDGDECRANFYFSSRTTGWFASHCTGSDDLNGYWLGGNWFVEDPGDTSPSFAATSGPGDQTYTVGTAIETLTLPQASGGDGALSYSLSPNVPGLSFDATPRELDGTPSTAGTYAITYTVMDEDGDTATLDFSITVSADSSETGSGGDCHVGLLVRIGESCTYPGTTDEFAVNVRGRGSFLTYLAGIRIRVNNQTINGRIYDFEASHQGDGVWRIDRVAGSTEPPSTNGDDNGGEMVGDSFEVEDVLSGVPSSGMFVPAALVSGFVEASDSGTTINLDNGGYIELSSGIRYTCTSADGCAVENGTVTRGTLVESTAGSAPDLVVDAPSVSDSDPATGQSFTLSVSVRNQGNGQSSETTLRYYQSSDDVVSMQDTEVGTDSVSELGVSATSEHSIELTAPTDAGTYYFGACVASVSGESDTQDNCSLAVAVTVDAAVPEDDRAVLMVLYNATDGANWTNSTNWLSSAPLSQWEGVDTDNSGRVTELELADNRLSGPIPGELGRLSNLESLYLQRNRLSGSIPAGLGDFSNLERLWLHSNQLSGTIPGELGRLSNLEDLSLYDNQLSGSIPAELGGLANLQEMSLNDNQFSGPVPGELGRLSNLESLYLQRNRLSGSIPAGLGDFSNLERLWLHSNQLSGTIPGELGRLSNLEDLSLYDNQLSGSIPAELGGLANLQEMSLNDNQFSGPVPGELGRLSNLESLYLQRNRLSGSIPAGLGDFSNLERLWLHSNQLSGTIPGELGRLSNLEDLSLYDNQLSGSIPAELGGLANLQEMSLNDNQFSGPVPGELGRLSNLESLYLQRNRLSGSIPAGLGGLSSVERLWLHRNQLTGSIPAELGDLSNLESLYLGDGNRLSGCIPSGLRDVPNSDLHTLRLPYCND